MSMSTNVVGIVPPDDEWKKMKKIWDACKEAGIEPPKDVWAFFNDEYPDAAGGIIEQEKLGKAVEEWSNESSVGFEVDLAMLPPHVKKLRFYNNW